MSPVLRAAGLVILLHRLIDIGLGDGPLAEQARDELEGLSIELMTAELALVEALSGRLNSARDAETAALTARTLELDQTLAWLTEARAREAAKGDG
jgi:hypothetical protein